MADGKTYRVMATDTAGTEFEVGAADEAIKALTLFRSARARLPHKAMRVLTADGAPVDPDALHRLAAQEVEKIAYERAFGIRRDAAGEAEEE